MKRKLILSISFIGLLFASITFDYDNKSCMNKLESHKEIIVGYHGKEYSDDSIYKVSRNKENDFMFELGNGNTMLYVTNIRNCKDGTITIEFFIKNNTDKEILASTNLICQKSMLDDTLTVLATNNNNKFKINNKQTTIQTIAFKVPSNIDLKNLRINILSETIDGNPLTDVTGKLNFTEI